MNLFIILHILEIKMPHSLRIFIHLFTQRSGKKELSKWVCLVMIIIFFIRSSLGIIRCNNSTALGGDAFLLS